MTVDKRISYDYVEQDGVNNYIKNSKSVTVPKEFKARKNAPATKLAYITADEAKMLKKKKPGTPHKGPKGIPSYDSFDAEGNYTSGTAMSAMETGSTDARDRGEVQASNYGAPSGAGPGVKTQAEQDLRAATIAAGAGQRVNPGFFDSRNVVSPSELAAARAFNPTAFKANRRGGIMDLFTGGGFLGNLVRGLGQRFGLGKRFDEPTYDMRRFSGLPLGGSAAFQNLDIRDIYDRRKTDEEEDTDRPLRKSTFFDDLSIDRLGSPDRFIYPLDKEGFQMDGVRTIIKNPNFSGDVNIPFGGTVLEDEFPSTEIDYGNPRNDPRVVPEEMGLVGDLGIMSVANAIKDENRKILENLFNPALNFNEALDKKEKEKKRQEELLKELMLT